MDNHPLKVVLQLHLASDANAVLHLPSILASMNAEALQPSAHTQKWTTRIHSLLHSKDAAARWAGLCIALHTSVYSRALMMECAQAWITVALPILSKTEPGPSMKAAIRLLRFVFAEATHFPEFQRQIATPNVPKFSAALVSLAERNEDEEVQTLTLETLTHLIPLYPTLHRALLSSLSNLALRYLNGSAPRPTSPSLLTSASALYSTLHHTGGKVGAANHWRKSVDDTLAFAWGALQNLRTTFPTAAFPQLARPANDTEDPMLSVALYLDRLRAAVQVLCDLMHASNPRAVVLPVGPISRLCVALLSCTANDQAQGHVDSVVHALESSVVPQIQELGCDLSISLSECAKIHLAPHLSQLLFYIARSLESNMPAAQRLPFLRAASTLLTQCPALSDPMLPSRLARAVLPILTPLLALQSQAGRDEDGAQGSKGRKGKKRARNYEGDELFKSREVVCPTQNDGSAVLNALDVLRRLTQSSPLHTAVQSLVGRTVLAIYVSLPQIPPSLFSPDLSLHGRVYEIAQRMCTEIGTGTTSVMGKTLGLLIGTSLQGVTPSDVLRDIDLMLHPRAPPLVRALPHVEALSLFRAEESHEETETRRKLGLVTNEEVHANDQARDVTPAQSEAVPMHPPAASAAAFQAARSTPAAGAAQIGVAAPQYTTAASSAVAASGPPVPVPHAADIQATHTATAPASRPSPPGPRPETLPSSSAAVPGPIAPAVPAIQPASSSSSTVAPQSKSIPAPVQMEVEDEDEPMPAIDTGSDSEAD